ncbi:50S ribosomal protein L22 [Wolbachia endosymbiont of Dirofilaria (Dirofilaria) immitis]|uniref:50S ribosomal protein L22 n=1 Tax=Wolbachia endosymbiont of Dirofilaria (Dirofilaria) immitis TaxID=1812115 RepID=UPI00158E3E92|nr:50S ribosomal protein L22 [Wolbachia endosymbiont of Dirofilaria (Dirofilaria) immitis]QKX02162.1 50S ribosomal protein L22 [Wolbachia endosymbiont of Dirofilaria (Dirofilaria) immitis]
MKDRCVVIKASSRVLKSTPRKLNLVASLVRNKKVSFATMQLRFCEKKVASLIAKVLNSAVANAQHNYGLDIDGLYIKEILVGKSFTLRRVYPKAMGRANRVNKYYSSITIKLEEVI